jgi:hypothetical protein
MDTKSLAVALNELKTMTGDSLLMCAARRQSLKPLVMLRQYMLGDLFPMVSIFCSKEMAAEQVYEHLINDPIMNQLLEQKKMDISNFTFNYVVLRHLIKRAPIFTVSPALHLLLEDSGVRENVPVKYFAAPAATCYIEFEPPEQRLASTFRTFAEGMNRVCEGCYVQETSFETLPNLSSFAMGALELDPHRPARQLNVSFSASPAVNVSGGGQAEPGQVGDDVVDFFTFFIQDEDECLGDMFDRHLKFYARRNDFERKMTEEAFASFTEIFKRNLLHLAKIFFYLNVEKRQQIKINDASELEARIIKVAEKKQRKLIQQRSRVYDRIVIGPKEYVPISKRLQTGDLPKGTVKPHYRRGYFGIRHVGSGQARHPELVRVKEALINEPLLRDSDIDPKQYEIR